MTKDSRDTGTPELARRQQVQPRFRSNQGNNYDLYVVDGSGPDRLLLNGKINTNEHAILLSYTVVLHKAKMLGPRSPSMERVTSSDASELSDRQSEAIVRVARISSMLDNKLGRGVRMDIQNLCMENRDSDRLEGQIHRAVAELGAAMDATATS